MSSQGHGHLGTKAGLEGLGPLRDSPVSPVHMKQHRGRFWEAKEVNGEQEARDANIDYYKTILFEFDLLHLKKWHPISFFVDPWCFFW